MKKLSENLFTAGCMLVLFGALSFLLSLINLEFKGLSFLGEYKSTLEIACVVIGLLLALVGKFITKNDLNDENE